MCHGPNVRRRVEDLTHHETVTALCEVCGHVSEVRGTDLRRKFPSFKRISDIGVLAAASASALS
jgi:hypothetical protein